MTNVSKPLILKEFNHYEGHGWVLIDPATGREIAHLTASYYVFMKAWMDAPLGLFEVITLEDEA